MSPDLEIPSRVGPRSLLILAMISALALLLWSGSSWNPRFVVPWGWTKEGWIIPMPGWVFVWFSSVMVFILLSAIAWRLFHAGEESGKLKPWICVAIILGLVIAVRLLIAWMWVPLPLDSAVLAAKILPKKVPLHWLALLADVVTVGLLLWLLRRAGRSLWWAVLYAMHPLTLIEIAGNGHWIAFALPALVLVAAFCDRLPRWAKLGIAGIVAFAAVAAVSVMASRPEFNSLTAALMGELGVSKVAVLPAVAALLQATVLMIAIRRDWALGRMLAHLLLMFLICSPMVLPWHVLPVLVLMPLAWTRAGWVLSLTVLMAFALVVTVKTRQGLELPMWLLMLEWMPVMVLEAQELLAETLAGRTLRGGASVIAAPPVT